MQILNSILLFAACVSAWTVPEGQPAGTYSVTNDAKPGKEVHTLIRIWNGTAHGHHERGLPGPLTLSNQVKARQIPNVENFVGCGGYILDFYNCNTATAMFDAQCGDGTYVAQNLDFYSIYGDSVVYFCNFSWRLYFGLQDAVSGLCWKGDRHASAQLGAEQCGSFYAYWNRFYRADNLYNGQYGQERTGSHFCGRGV